MSAGLFGYIGYDMVRLIERLPDANPDVLGVPDGLFLRPTVIAVFDNIEDKLTIVTPVWPVGGDHRRARLRRGARRGWPTPSPTSPAPCRTAADRRPPAEPLAEPRLERHAAPATTRMVERAKEYISAGDIFQVVPSQRFRVPFALPPFALYRALRRLNPSPFLFFLAFDGFAVVGSSPEIMVRVRDGKVTIRPIAGTRPRGATPEEDRALAAELLADPKERAEHLMLLDLGRNDVGRVARVGTVRVTEQMRHRALLARHAHRLQRRGRARPQVRRHRRADRRLSRPAPSPARRRSGRWRSSTSWSRSGAASTAAASATSAPSGELDTCIALRTAIVKDGMLYVQAGGGVVADSDPEAEYQETCNKARALLRAAEEAAGFAEPE